MSAWLLPVFVPIGLLLLLAALWVFNSLTAAPVYSDPASVSSVTSSAPSPKWGGAVETAQRIVRASIVEQNLPGVSVAVGIDGEILWAEAFGFADLLSREPVTPNHRFSLGTASTVLTSAAAGLLLEKGQLKLDDEIQTYVPAFPKKQWPVTLRELMAHTAGLPLDGNDELHTRHCDQPAEALQYFAERPLLFQPGTQYGYSSYGWILVSAAIEAAANQPFLAFMREQVFDPLGMHDTAAAPSPDPAVIEGEDAPIFTLIRELIYDPKARHGVPNSPTPPPQGHVTSYVPRFSSDPNNGIRIMRPVDYSCYAGASVFASTPSDLVRFGMAIQSGKLLKPATVELLQTPQRLASGEETGYGLGWRVKTVTLGSKQARAIGHDGESLGGRVASLLTFPDNGIVVAVTSNIAYTDTFSLGVKIAQAFAER